MECGIPYGVKGLKAMVAKSRAKTPLVTTEIQGGPTRRQKTSSLSPKESDSVNRFSSKPFRIYVYVIMSL